MNKKIEAIIENGILGLMEEYFDWYGELNDKVSYIFETMFEGEEFELSQNGKVVAEFWSNSISRSCSEEEVNLAYECSITKENELNENFYNIFPKMFSDILLQIKEINLKNMVLTQEQEIGYQVIEYLGKETLGANKFIKMVKEEIAKKNESDKQVNL